MARLGKKPIAIPDKIKVEIKDGAITVTGGKGTLSRPVFPGLDVALAAGQVQITNTVSEKDRKLFHKTDALHGLMRTLVLNMIAGVNVGFEKILEIHGIGYKAEIKGQSLGLALGTSHPVALDIPSGLAVEVVKNTILFIRGSDKELVGRFSAKIRALFPPEPYKGTGIRYRGEYVRQKVGKAAVGATK